MKAARIYPLAVGILVGLILAVLKALHLYGESPWLAGIVGGISGGMVSWLGPKLNKGIAKADGGGSA